jgi:two-component system OmpR family response regulator
MRVPHRRRRNPAAGAISATLFHPSSTFRPCVENGKVERSGGSAFARRIAEGGRPGGGLALRLLVIEDDPDLNRQLATALTDAGYVVDRAFDGEEGHFLGESEPYDAVILDIGLPKMDGISVLEAWRRAGRAMPVLILTARDRWSDKVQGFDAGADDYVAKPFHLEEVLARIRALLRRSAGHAKSELNCGAVRLDTRTGRVTVAGNPVKLTSHEYRLLSYLMHHTGRVVSRSELVEHLYDQDFDRDSNTIEVFVGRIRKKLGVDVIQTVRGLGYLLTAPGNAP